MPTVDIVVQNAGCASCGDRVRDALGSICSVEELVIDEAADSTVIRLFSSRPLSIEDVDRVLEAASDGSGHAYAVQPGSWAQVS